MKKHMMILLLAATILLPIGAQGEILFSFNTVSAKDFIKICRLEGINIPKELAEALVSTREKGLVFKNTEDLRQVPGMTQLYLQQLYPLEENGDVYFDPEHTPLRAGY